MASQDKVAFITGANKGIGLETARGLGELGIAVVIGSRDEAKGRAAAEKLKAEGIKGVEAVRFDVTRPEDHKAIARFLEDRYGKLDILVNNAGVVAGGRRLRRTRRVQHDVHGDARDPPARRSRRTSSPSSR